MKKLFSIYWEDWNNILIILPIFFIILYLIIYKFLWQKKTVKILTGSKINFLKNFSLTKSKIKMFFLTLGILFLSLSLLRPKWDQKEEIVEQEGRDLVIALDISKSMLAQDVNPNRLDFAKNKIKQLIKNLQSDRIALIIFSENAFIQCPLTEDFDIFYSFLDAIDKDTVSSGGTSLGAAIKKGIEIYKNVPSNKSKLLIIFTDGEDFSEDLSSIKQEVINLNLKIFTFGVGSTEGAPIPLYNDEGKHQGYLKDEKNNIIISRLNEQLLQNLSKETGAIYISGKKDNSSDIELLLNKIQSFEKEKIKKINVKNFEEKYYYFTFIALICVILQWIL